MRLPKIDAGKALIVANLLKNNAAEESRIAAEELQKRGWTTKSFSFKGDPNGAPDFSGYDLVISLGGDGTLLYTAHFAALLGIPVLPVNLGTLGFIAANRSDTWLDTFDAWRSGSIAPSSRRMLKIDIKRADKIVSSHYALNDGVISSQGIVKMIKLRLSVDGDMFGSYRADGLIIATPTGSTAYNLAAGGPALFPEMDAIVINSICPFMLASRPLVLPTTAKVEVTIDETRRSGAMLTLDGQETVPLKLKDKVYFSRAPYEMLLVVPPKSIFFSALRTKLGWSGDADA